MNVSSDMYTLPQRRTDSWKTTSHHFRLFLCSELHLSTMALGPQQPLRYSMSLCFFDQVQRSNFPRWQWREWPAWGLAMLNACDGSPWPFMTDQSLLFPICFSLVLFRVSFPRKSFVLLAFPNSLFPPSSLDADLSKCRSELTPSDFLGSSPFRHINSK